MEKIRKVKITRLEDLIVDIVCNKCGKSCRGTDPSIDKNKKHYSKAFYGLIETTVYGSYFSPALTDETSYTFSLCEACIAKMIKKFVIPPKTKTTY